MDNSSSVIQRPSSTRSANKDSNTKDSIAPTPKYPLPNFIRLKNDIEMPHIHFGVGYSEKDTHSVIITALQFGFRGFDGSSQFSNSAVIGKAIRTFLDGEANTKGLTRRDIWFTSKLCYNFSYDDIRQSIKSCVSLSGMEYIDLYLLQNTEAPREKMAECWRAVEDAIEAGEVRMGGVRDWGLKHVSNATLQSQVYTY